jgi:hypothetical protein
VPLEEVHLALEVARIARRAPSTMSLASVLAPLAAQLANPRKPAWKMRSRLPIEWRC